MATRRPSSKTLHQNNFKLIVVGEANAGKTSLANCFAHNKFSENTNLTFQSDVIKKTLQLTSGESVDLEIWDTAGQERFRSLTSSYYRGAQGVFIVCDVTNQDLVSQVKDWLKELEFHLKTSDVVVFVICTKIDLCNNYKSRTKTLRTYCDQIRAIESYFEVSSKTGENVIKAFEKMTELISKRTQATETSASVKVAPEDKKTTNKSSFFSMC